MHGGLRRANQIRGFLVEHGAVMRKGRGGFCGFVPTLLSGEAGPLAPAIRQRVGGLWEEWCATDAAVQDLSRQLEHLTNKLARITRAVLTGGEEYKGRVGAD